MLSPGIYLAERCPVGHRPTISPVSGNGVESQYSLTCGLNTDHLIIALYKRKVVLAVCYTETCPTHFAPNGILDRPYINSVTSVRCTPPLHSVGSNHSLAEHPSPRMLQPNMSTFSTTNNSTFSTTRYLHLLLQPTSAMPRHKRSRCRAPTASCRREHWSIDSRTTVS